MRLDVVTLYKKAHKVAMLSRFYSIADDFCAWYIIRVLEGKSQHQLIRHALYDYLESEIMPKKRLKLCLDDLPIDSNRFSQEDRVVLFDLLKKHSTGLEDKLLWLYLIDGLDMKTIGEMFGISESRVCQRFAELSKRVREGRSPSSRIRRSHARTERKHRSSVSED